jgi:AcrR family transcriptional regulator
MKTPSQPNDLYAAFLNFKPSRSDHRKIALLESTIDCIASIGVESITLEELGNRTDMTKAHVAYHFKSCRLLIEAAIKFVISTGQSETVNKVSKAEEPREKLIAFIEATFEWFEKFPKHASVMLLFYYYANTQDEYRALHTEVRELGAKRLAAILGMMGLKGTKNDFYRCAKLVQGILTASVINRVTTNQRDSWDSVRKSTLKDILRLVDEWES